MDCEMSLDGAMDVFANMAKETSISQAYQTFTSRVARQQMSIPDPIWRELEPAIQEKIKAIRAKVNAMTNSTKAEAPTKPQTGIPPQYPTMQKANLLETTEDDSHKAYFSLCEKLGAMTTASDEDTDDDELQATVFMTSSIPVAETPDPDALIIRAHLEYVSDSSRNYAISDSGADSSILGKHCHVISHTGRSAYLVGYDPHTTRSSKIPIVSGYVKVRSQV